MSDITPFFTVPHHQKALKDFLESTAARSHNRVFSPTAPDYLNACRDIFGDMIKQPDIWDVRCQFNIKNTGELLIKTVNGYGDSTPEYIADMYVHAFRFLYEFYLSVPSGENLSYSFQEIIDQNEEGFTDSLRVKLHNARYITPIRILKEIISNENITSFRVFDAKTEEVKKSMEELNSVNAEVQRLEKSLKDQKKGFGFVHLQEGFSDLKKIKEEEIDIWQHRLKMLGMVLLMLPLLIFMFGFPFSSVWNGYSHYDSKILPLVSIEIILLYFFRICLLNYKSAQSQLMQIELRMALCRFIEHYAEFSQKFKETEALRKFENMIFSAILPNPEKLPATFYGVDELKNLLKKD